MTTNDNPDFDRLLNDMKRDHREKNRQREKAGGAMLELSFQLNDAITRTYFAADALLKYLFTRKGASDLIADDPEGRAHFMRFSDEKDALKAVIEGAKDQALAALNELDAPMRKSIIEEARALGIDIEGMFGGAV